MTLGQYEAIPPSCNIEQVYHYCIDICIEVYYTNSTILSICTLYIKIYTGVSSCIR